MTVKNTRAADKIEVEEFREIFQWPLFLDSDHPSAACGLKELFRQQHATLSGDRGDESPWTLIDPLTFLSAEIPTDGGPYGEFIYFHDFTQKFLYPPKGDREVFTLYQRHDIKRLDAVIDGCTHQFQVVRLTMHMFTVGIAVLTLELKWTGSPDVKRLTLNHVQRIIDYLRRSYTPFFIDDKPQRVPEKVTLHVSPSKPPHYREKEPFGPQSKVSVQQRVESPDGNAANLATGKLETRPRDVPVFGHWSKLISPLRLLCLTSAPMGQFRAI